MMGATSMRRVIRRHLFLLLSVMLTLAGFFLVGLGLTRYSNESGLPEIIGNNGHYLLVWRLLVYGLVISYWPRLVSVIMSRRYGDAPEASPDKRIYRRQPIVLVCLAFEFLVAQNIIGVLLTHVYLAVSG
jgi:hypothetical protein